MQFGVVILCLAYILGLLSTAAPWGGYYILAGGIGAAIVLPRFFASSKFKIWLIAGMFGLLANFYLQMRLPQPAANNISRSASASDQSQEQIVIVQGQVASTPRLTRSQRGQFLLQTTQLSSYESAGLSGKVTGKLYVTAPLLQITGLHPGQAIAVTGVLYKPKSATNPGAFDFKAYLERQGIFAGLKGREINFVPSARTAPVGMVACAAKNRAIAGSLVG